MCAQGGKQGSLVEIDMLAWMGRTALELVGQAGLGYSFEQLTSDAPDELGTAIKNFQYVLLYDTPLSY